MMSNWWCMDCRSQVALDKHGRCGCCESEAVDLMEQTDLMGNEVLTNPMSMVAGDDASASA